MPDNGNGKENGKERKDNDLFAVSLKLTGPLYRLVERLLEQAVASGRLLSQSDIIRDLMADGVAARGLSLEPFLLQPREPSSQVGGAQ